MSGCYQSAGLSIVNVCLISVTILEKILFSTVGVDKVIKIISFLSSYFPIGGKLTSTSCWLSRLSGRDMSLGLLGSRTIVGEAALFSPAAFVST